MEFSHTFALLSCIFGIVSCGDPIEVMVFAWAPAECDMYSGSDFCNNTSGTEVWVIKQYGCFDTAWKDDCNRTDLPNATALHDVEAELKTSWPNFRGSDEDQWLEHYQKFGCCNHKSGDRPSTYFENALEKWQQNSISATLKSAGIEPHNSEPRTRQEINVALKGDQIDCVESKKKQLLESVAVCYNLGTNKKISCPRNILPGRCNAAENVFYIGGSNPSPSPGGSVDITPYLIGGAVGSGLTLSTWVVFLTFKYLKHGKSPYQVLMNQ